MTNYVHQSTVGHNISIVPLSTHQAGLQQVQVEKCFDSMETLPAQEQKSVRWANQSLN